LRATAAFPVLDNREARQDNHLVRQGLPVAVAGLLLVAACGRSINEPLVVEQVSGPTSATVKDTARFRCEVRQFRPGPLEFAWACSTGRLAWDWGHSVRWHAPETSGRSWLSVTVADNLGNNAAETLRLTVPKRVVWPVIWDGAVKPYSYAHWADSMWAGYRLAGQSGSDSVNVFLLVMADSDYVKWAAGRPASYIVRRFCYIGGTFSDTLKSTGMLHVVIDNTGCPTETDFWVRISLTSP